MVQLNDQRIRLTMEQAIMVLDLFAGSTPSWLAQTPVTKAAALMAAGSAREPQPDRSQACDQAVLLYR
jgi:hypothetical protein